MIILRRMDVSLQRERPGLRFERSRETLVQHRAYAASESNPQACRQRENASKRRTGGASISAQPAVVRCILGRTTSKRLY